MVTACFERSKHVEHAHLARLTTVATRPSVAIRLHRLAKVRSKSDHEAAVITRTGSSVLSVSTAWIHRRHKLTSQTGGEKKWCKR